MGGDFYGRGGRAGMNDHARMCCPLCAKGVHVTTPARSSYYCIVCLKTGRATSNPNGTFTLEDATT